MSTVGLSALHRPRADRAPGRAQARGSASAARPGQLALVLVADRLVVDHEAAAVEAGDGARQVVARQPLAAQGRRAAGARCRRRPRRRPGSRRAAARAACRWRAPARSAGDRHRGGPLDVVVERRQDARDSARAARTPLPFLKSSHWSSARGKRRRTACTNSSTSASYAAPRSRGCRQPDVEVVVEQGLVVGADVEADGQRRGRMDAGGRRVERELADGDAHAARALVAEAEDALVVGDDDEAHVVVRARCPAPPSMRPRCSGVIQMPRARRKMWLNSLAGLARRSACRRWAGAPRGVRAARGRRGARCGPAGPPARCSAPADRSSARCWRRRGQPAAPWC